MRAVDTNILVRLLMRDDPRQLAQVVRMLQEATVCVTPTVILETEWVLRRAYQLKSAEIALGFRGLLGLPDLQFESADAVARALDWLEGGMDFADALHLATAPASDGFVTFDRDFINAAAHLGAGQVVEP